MTMEGVAIYVPFKKIVSETECELGESQASDRLYTARRECHVCLRRCVDGATVLGSEGRRDIAAKGV